MRERTGRGGRRSMAQRGREGWRKQAGTEGRLMKK